jgi:Ni,Fe-hydrogenase III small subunit
MKIFKNRLRKGIVTVDSACFKTLSASAARESSGNELKELINKRFSRSFHIREVDTGSCGACESEIISATNPIYDLQRFGVDFVASPRHADALLVTGPVSKNMETALKKTYDAMPGHKIVITFGDCAFNGGLFGGSYYTLGGVNKILPVSLHVPGCPPKPADLISCLLNYLKSGK